VIIVWDEPKRLTNLASRGLDFAELDDSFFASALIERARDARLKAVGTWQNITLTVIFSPLGTETISIVSMRHASRNERKAYGQAQTERPN
jgi:uncharacterized DUF497 family protein